MEECNKGGRRAIVEEGDGGGRQQWGKGDVGEVGDVAVIDDTTTPEMLSMSRTRPKVFAHMSGKCGAHVA